MDLKNLLDIILLQAGTFTISLYQVVLVVLVLMVTRLILWLIQQELARRMRAGRLDSGRKHSLFQIARYVVWVIAIALCLEALGFDVTLLVAGSAALLVGIGLGLQPLFQDIVSGIILLIEGIIEVGDVIETTGIVGRVQRITLRSTVVKTRDDIIIIIPNHKFIAENVVNWSHNNDLTRFEIPVQVAYGMDPDLVRDTLLACVQAHPQVIQTPDTQPFVWLTNFGESGVDFKLYFWSDRPFEIEGLKSDLRWRITAGFQANNIQIPFPQLDVYMKS
ncbi:MAG: mechanosensitive ion channel [Bacteroidia bacterium]|nr:mechanosensitive ion channel [Bacteroidia bacterium]